MTGSITNKKYQFMQLPEILPTQVLRAISSTLSLILWMSAQAQNTSPDVDARGAPLLIRPDGKLTHEAFSFSSTEYEHEALRAVVREANTVAQQLGLPEDLPITESDLTQSYIIGYGLSLMKPRMIGNIHTRHFGYFVSVDHKFSSVMLIQQEEQCRRWAETVRLPRARFDASCAYNLATQWLTAVSMDVAQLNRDCHVHVSANKFWNAGIRRGSFVPIYDISWMPKGPRTDAQGNLALVTLFLPTKALVSLTVYDTRYISRKPIRFSNLDQLLRTAQSGPTHDHLNR